MKPGWIQGNSIVLPGGHKVPILLLGVIATIVAALIIVRSQKPAAAPRAISVGTVPATQSLGSGVFGGAGGADFSGALSALSGQVADLQHQLLIQGQMPGSGPAPAPFSEPSADFLSRLSPGVPLHGTYDAAGNYAPIGVGGATTNIAALYAGIRGWQAANPGHAAELVNPRGDDVLFLPAISQSLAGAHA